MPQNVLCEDKIWDDAVPSEYIICLVRRKWISLLRAAKTPLSYVTVGKLSQLPRPPLPSV